MRETSVLQRVIFCLTTKRVTFDYQVVNSDIEAERDHLHVGDHIAHVLTVKEAITETRPLVVDALLARETRLFPVSQKALLALASGLP